MLRAHLIGKLVAGTELTKGAADLFLQRLSSIIREEVAKGNRVLIPGLGTFFSSQRPARRAGDPNDSHKNILVPATTISRFSASQSLKRAAKNSHNPYAGNPKPE